MARNQLKSHLQMTNAIALQFRWRDSPPASSKINSPRGPLRVVVSPKGNLWPQGTAFTRAVDLREVHFL